MRFVFVTSFLALAFVSSGCVNDTRFPVCKSDAECAAREENGGKLLCDNLRCVQCRYDNDCPGGSYCDKTLTCQEISPKQKEDPDVVTADYKTFDECTKACQDSACTDVCNARFPDAAKKSKRKRR